MTAEFLIQLGLGGLALAILAALIVTIISPYDDAGDFVGRCLKYIFVTSLIWTSIVIFNNTTDRQPSKYMETAPKVAENSQTAESTATPGFGLNSNFGELNNGLQGFGMGSFDGREATK